MPEEKEKEGTALYKTEVPLIIGSKRQRDNLIIGSKRQRDNLTEVPFPEEEQEEEQGENLLQVEKLGEMADGPVDDKILDLLILIRWSSTGYLNEVPIRFNSRHIWAKIARIMNLEFGPSFRILEHQVYNRAKAMRKQYRARVSIVEDKLNEAFGNCHLCGYVVEFPRIYMGRPRNATVSNLQLAHSQPSTSHSQPSASYSQPSASHSQPSATNVHLALVAPPPSDSRVAAIRINNLIEANEVTLSAGVDASIWLESHQQFGAQLFLSLSRDNLIRVVNERIYDALHRQQNDDQQGVVNERICDAFHRQQNDE